MLAVIVSLWFALSACGKRKPEALTQLSVGAVSSSIWEWPCNHPWITLGAVIAFVSRPLQQRVDRAQEIGPVPFNGYKMRHTEGLTGPRMKGADSSRCGRKGRQDK
jgi:hypothetical protein